MKKNSTRQVGAGDLPIFSEPQIPEDAYLILLTEGVDYEAGGKFQAAFRLPIERVTGASGTASSGTHSVYAPAAGITVPENKVVPAFRESFGIFQLRRAQANNLSTLAQFLIVADDVNVDNSYIVASNGFYQFPGSHGYLVGQKYYLDESNPGQVTTSPPAIAQELFTVIDNRTILINIKNN